MQRTKCCYQQQEHNANDQKRQSNSGGRQTIRAAPIAAIRSAHLGTTYHSTQSMSLRKYPRSSRSPVLLSNTARSHAAHSGPVALRYCQGRAASQRTPQCIDCWHRPNSCRHLDTRAVRPKSARPWSVGSSPPVERREPATPAPSNWHRGARRTGHTRCTRQQSATE